VACVLAGLAAGLMAPATEAFDPGDCTIYAQPRVFLESQDWWDPIPVLGGRGHVHMGMCWPAGQTIRGTITFYMKIVFHHNVGTLDMIKLQDDRSRLLTRRYFHFRPPDGGDTTVWQRFVIDTRRVPDGRRLFRWYARFRQPNGNIQFARAGWVLNVENGRVNVNGAPSGYFQGSGWYKEARPASNWGYQTAIIKSGIPLGPVHGIWRPRVSIGCNGCHPQTSWMATIDPDFHMGDAGWLFARGLGGFSGNLAIDTTRLENGPHKLVLISASRRTYPSVRQHNGLLAISFSVQN
jgi:hypothetical protein